MKAVLRLVLAYFTGTPILRWTTLLGLACIAASCIVLLALPPLVGQNGLPLRFALWQETVLNLLPVIGVIAFAFGASLLPTLVNALVRGHSLYVLPFGRAKVLTSVFLTIALIALIASAASLVFYVRTNVPLSFVFSRSFPVSLATYSLVYIVLWFTSRSRSAVTAVLGAVAIIGTLMLPIRYVNLPATPVTGLWAGVASLWSAFAAIVLLAPRYKGAVARAARAVASKASRMSYRGGAELDLVLGTAQPVRIALAQLVPIAVASVLLPALPTGYATHPPPSPWLFFMTLLSVLAAAPASFAASRSRSLWLRAGWTRSELFARVEHALWRHGAVLIVTTSLALVAIGYGFALLPRVLASGVALVVLGTAISTYLGLMITATITWAQTAAALVAIGLLLRTAYGAASPDASAGALLALGAALAATAVAFRFVARRNWRELDWMRCRGEWRVRAAS